MTINLTKYIQNDHFTFKQGDSLRHVCNAPTDKGGIYLVHALKKSKRELIYIGRSGKLEKDGLMRIRKAGLGGIKDRIVNGHQFGKTPRRISWPRQMEHEGIEELEIHWYVTHNDQFKDCPRLTENKLLRDHFEVFGKFPSWNKEL